ncbi:hypothetical protein SLA2020_475310 [Shorea laevis]
MASRREAVQHRLTQTQIFPFLFVAIFAVLGVVSIFSPLFYCVFPTQPHWHLSSPHCHKSDPISGHRETQVNYGNTNLSHILFGISGSAKTWSNRRFYTELWWKPKITRGFVWLDEKPSENKRWPVTSPPYRVSGDTSNFTYTFKRGTRSAVRIARIVKESFELGLDNVRWFVMGDDDTFFFLENLVTVLEKYDYNEMYYIGSNSESAGQDAIHSYSMAYGGAGFAISYPLAAELFTVLDGCIDRYASFYGSDQKVHGCISEIGVPLTKELGFHQVDIRGDLYGLLAAHPLAPLVSLHHLNYVQSIFPNMTQIDSLKRLMSAYQVDPGRTLQQSICYDLNRKWSISVSWGYTVQLYPSLVTTKDLETAFQTFQVWKRKSKEQFVFNTRPMSSDPCKKPVVYFFESVENVAQDRSLTRYKRFVDLLECNGTDYTPLFAVEFINVSASTLSSETWKMAPRRQCCEVVNGSDLQVNIRGCNLQSN